MFGGIIVCIGGLTWFGNRRVQVVVCDQTGYLKDIVVGDSIAINGTCLTVATIRRDEDNVYMQFDLSDETYNVTTFHKLNGPFKVNVERPLKFGEFLGGHVCSGHVNMWGEVCHYFQYQNGSYEIFIKPQTWPDPNSPW